MKNIFEIKNNFNADLSNSILKWGDKGRESHLISIIIPVYNRIDFFKKALDSALKQDCSIPYSIIIIDNNYDEDIDNINIFEKYISSINSTKILYYKNKKNLGPIGNFNCGIQLSQAEYFVMCHEDDELCENCLSELWKFKIDHHIDKEFVLPLYTYINDDDSPRNNSIAKKRFYIKDYYRLNLIDWFLSCSTNGAGALINRNALMNVGGYDENYRPGADYALFTLYSYTFGAYRLRKVLYKYRIGETNLSNNVIYTGVERDKFIMDCIKDKLWIPNFILNRIIKAHVNNKTECNEKMLLKKNIHPASKIDKYIMKIANKILELKHRFGQIRG